jgi:ankyrin repeat protein
MLGWTPRTCGICRKSYASDETYIYFALEGVGSGIKRAFLSTEMGLLSNVEAFCSEKKTTTLNVRSGDRSTLLMRAVEFNQISIVRFLIGQNAHLNSVNEEGDTALMLACYKGYIEIVNVFLNCGRKLDINKKNADGYTAVAIAVSLKYYGIVSVLLEHHDVNLNLPNVAGDTPLLIALKNQDLSLVQKLRLAGASLTIRDIDNKTPLAITVSNGNFECFQYLIKHGASVKDKIGSFGDSILILACKKGRMGMVEMILQEDDGLNLNSINNVGNSALMEASKAGCEDIVKLLLEKKAKPTVINRYGSTALSYAVDGDFEEIKTLIRKATLLM